MNAPFANPRIPPVKTPLELYHRALSASEALNRVAAMAVLDGTVAEREIGHLEQAAAVTEAELNTAILLHTGLTLDDLRKLM
jgi:hypothetical protein